ncbi:hypothetical protein GGG16DRAFT_45895 [Schizophyllum commune]
MHPSRPTYYSTQRQHGAGSRHASSRGPHAYGTYTALSPGAHDGLIDNSGQGKLYGNHPSQASSSPSQYPQPPYGGMQGLYDVDPRPMAASASYPSATSYTAPDHYIGGSSLPAGLAIPDPSTSTMGAVSPGSYNVNPYAPATHGDFLPSPISPFMPPTSSTPYDYYTSSSPHQYSPPSSYESAHQAHFPYGMPATTSYYDPGSPSALSSDGSSAVHSSPEQRSSEHDRRRHIESVHKNHTVQCDKCLRTFTRLDSCQRHTDSGNCTPAPRRVRKRT